MSNLPPFESFVDVDETGCWLWRGRIWRGRGRYGKRAAHRVAYELGVGPITNGDEIHHRCENPLCVRPDHLEALSPEEHRERHQAPAECPRGHEPDWRISTRGARVCRHCDRERNERNRTASKTPCTSCGKPRGGSGKRHYGDTGLCASCYAASLITHPRGGWAARV